MITPFPGKLVLAPHALVLALGRIPKEQAWRLAVDDGQNSRGPCWVEEEHRAFIMSTHPSHGPRTVSPLVAFDLTMLIIVGFLDYLYEVSREKHCLMFNAQYWMDASMYTSAFDGYDGWLSHQPASSCSCLIALASK